jgi:hypothetical protein
MRDTTHLRLLAGETEAFRASNSDGCPWAKLEDNMIATNGRVLFLSRQWVFSMCVASHEEAFYLEDLQFLSLARGMSWLWLWCALLGLIIGAIMLAGKEAAAVAIGIILLLAGIVCLAVFFVKHLSRGVYLSLNFSRKNAGIVDWQMRSWWKPRMSSTRRIIKLPKETAQEAYNVLNQLLHDRFSLKVSLRDPRARESAGDM